MAPSTGGQQEYSNREVDDSSTSPLNLPPPSSVPAFLAITAPNHSHPAALPAAPILTPHPFQTWKPIHLQEMAFCISPYSFVTNLKVRLHRSK